MRRDYGSVSVGISLKLVLKRAFVVLLLALVVQALILAYSFFSLEAYLAKVPNSEFQQSVQLMDSVLFLYRNDLSNDHLAVVENYLSDVHSRESILCLNVFSQDGVIHESFEKSLIGRKIQDASCGGIREDSKLGDDLGKRRMCIQRPVFNSTQCNGCHDSAKRVLGILALCVKHSPQELGRLQVVSSVKTSVILTLATALLCFLVFVVTRRNHERI